MSTTTAPTISLPLLQRVQIASPCHARWEDMTGDERTRHCAECSLDVHNLSAMTTAQAEDFLRPYFNADGSANGRICGRIYRRSDGTILTADCPVGVAALRAKARRAAVRVAAALGITSLVAAAAALEQQHAPSWIGCQPFSALTKAIGRQPAVPVQTGWSGGLVCPTPVAPAPLPPLAPLAPAPSVGETR